MIDIPLLSKEVFLVCPYIWSLMREVELTLELYIYVYELATT